MPESPKQRSIESYGLGQSGYTAGRVEGDPSLERQMEARNEAFADPDTHVDDLGDDERFSPRYQRTWAPKPAKEPHA